MFQIGSPFQMQLSANGSGPRPVLEARIEGTPSGLGNAQGMVLDAGLSLTVEFQGSGQMPLQGWTLLQPPSSPLREGRFLSAGTFVLPLDVVAISKLEDLRASRDLRFEGTIRLRILQAPPNGEVIDAFGRVQLLVPQSQWVKSFLPGLGVQGYEIWEMRLATVPEVQSLHAEAKHLREAFHDLHMGNYRATFAKARLCVEGIKTKSRDLGLDHELTNRAMNTAESYFSAPLHVKAMEGDPDRLDAEAALGIAMSLFRRVSHLVLNRSNA